MRSPTTALLLALSLATPELAAQWSQLSPANRPYFRRAGAMAFDGALNVMYGGLTLTPAPIVNETWTFNGTAWTLANPAVSPPARWGHGMVRDTLRNRLVVFGGRSPTFYLDSNDTWEWNGSNWARVLTPSSPPARHGHGIAFDRRRNLTVVFGGVDTQGTRADTWEYDGATWTQATTTTAPQKRECMAMTFDRGRGVTLVFGGFDSDTGTVLGDTWEYDRRGWRELALPSSPSPRYRSAIVFDENRHRPVMYGGFGNGTVFTQGFEFDGNEWQPVVGTGSLYATEMYASFDPIRNRTYTFGGANPSGFSNETWAFQGANRAIFSSYGVGCPSSSGQSDMRVLAPPVLGTQFRYEVTNVPLAQPFVFLAQGFDNLTWNAAPLPIDLTQFGFPDCWLELSPVSIDLVPAVGGTAQFAITIPNSPALTNVTYFAQALVIDQFAPNGLGGVSRAARAVVGLLVP